LRRVYFGIEPAIDAGTTNLGDAGFRGAECGLRQKAPRFRVGKRWCWRRWCRSNATAAAAATSTIAIAATATARGRNRDEQTNNKCAQNRF